jgi:hypothetical protein
MGKVTFTNIVAGEAKIFIGPDQSTVDANITSVGDNSTYNVGATQNGVSIAWEPTMVDIEVDQFGDAARVIQNKQKVMIKTTLAEATLSNLAAAWGYDTGVGAASPGLVSGYSVAAGGTFNIGIHSVYPTEKYIRIEGNAPGSNATTTVYRTYKNGRAIQYSTSEHSIQRADNVKFAVDFRILPDSASTGKEYGSIVDATSAPYSPYL